ncbi:MAG: hypothetical protein EAX96_09000 [Candidatus Lokiarchaeota archaeon]|nr:hypothetical protein [Candidatus Lokiarchaeota archaeon]
MKINLMNPIEKAMISIKKSRKKAENCPYRPKFHFIAPSNWMNDPNGTIYYKNEYHLFYQHNPYGTKWGNIHWGHAKSKDLVHWTHMPIALVPSKELGENHCFSGCCVINNEVPTILYTKIGSIFNVIKGAEQWLAISEDELTTWKKYKDNPVMTDKLHYKIEVRNWRDPYIWFENNTWYSILGGQIKGKKHGVIFLYKSPNLIDWEYLHPLYEGKRSFGAVWECPNFFRLGEKHILIISPHGKVKYAIGSFKDHRFKPEKWDILDYGSSFYATNTIIKNDRVILFGWIKYGRLGNKYIKGWNGCISLPRIISINKRRELNIEPAAELKILRQDNYKIEELVINSNKNLVIDDTYNNSFELSGKIQILDANQVIFNITNCRGKAILGFDINNQVIFINKEKGKVNFSLKNENIDFDIFIDKSVIEMFVNKKACLTSKFYPKNGKNQQIEINSKSGRARLLKFNIWRMKSIW